MSAATRSLLSLAIFLAITFGVATVGAQFGPGLWYEDLDKPPWNPPNWIFAPVWSILYLIMAIAAWLVWRRLSALDWPIILWLAQLGLNSAWSWLFFGLQSPGLAAIEIVVLLAAILATVLVFFRIDRLAGLLLVPYAAWVSFASLLNLSIWSLNR